MTRTHHDFLFFIDRIRKAALPNNFLVEVGIGHVCQESWVEDREKVVKEKRKLCFDKIGSISCTNLFSFFFILYYNLVVVVYDCVFPYLFGFCSMLLSRKLLPLLTYTDSTMYIPWFFFFLKILKSIYYQRRAYSLSGKIITI